MPNRPQNLILKLLFVLLPLIGTLALVTIHLQADLFNFKPTAVNDEMMNWHQIATFRQVGFNGGYYTIHEMPADATFSRFFVHGPVFPVLYGLAAKVFGWAIYSPPLYNIALMTLTLIGVLLIIRPDRKQLGWLIVAMATFGPLFMFLPSNMQEPVHHALGLIFAAFFYRLLNEGHWGRWTTVAFFALVIIAGLMRPTWLVMAGLYVVVIGLRSRRQPLKVVALVVGLLVFVWVMQQALFAISAPVPPANTTIDEREIVYLRYEMNLPTLWANFQRNVRILFDNWTNVVGVELQTMLLAMVTAGGFIYYWQRRRTTPPQSKLTMALIALQLAAVIGFVLVVYDVRLLRGYRLMASHLLFSIVLLAALRHYRVVGLMVLVNMLLLPSFLDLASDYRTISFIPETPSAELFQQQTAPYLAYDPDADNPWCNTVLTALLPYDVVGIPTGMGISHLLFNTVYLQTPLQSRYFVMGSFFREMIEDGAYYGMDAPYPLNVEVLTETTVGTLYLNLDADCD